MTDKSPIFAIDCEMVGFLNLYEKVVKLIMLF